MLFIFAWISGDVCRQSYSPILFLRRFFLQGGFAHFFQRPADGFPDRLSPAGGLGGDVVVAVAGFDECLGHVIQAFLFFTQLGCQGLRIFIRGLVGLARQAGFLGVPYQGQIIKDNLLAWRKPARVDVIPISTSQG